MSKQESTKRMVDIVGQAKQDGVEPSEYVRRTIQEAIGYGSPFIKPGHQFIIMGVDGFDGSMFPCGSSDNMNDAWVIVREKIAEEPLYSHDDDLSATFHIFTDRGVHIPLEDDLLKR